MSFALIEACKKRKRWPKFFRFNSFGDPGIPIVPLGTFRDNVRVFLQEAGEPEDYSVSGNPFGVPFSSMISPTFVSDFNFLGFLCFLFLEMGLAQVWVFELFSEML
ncbi:hypothetical protein ACSQ67_017390 [Phaseolus vulgaris]